MLLPAVVVDDVCKQFAPFWHPGILCDEFIVTVMTDVSVDWNQIDVFQPNVHSDARVTEPVEVRHLLRVRYVIGRLEVAIVVEIFHEDFKIGLNPESCEQQTEWPA